MEIRFLDPDAKKKNKYLNHLGAIEKRKNREGLLTSEIIIIAKFFERKKLNNALTLNVNRTDLLNVTGWVRTLFKLQPYEQAMNDLKTIGIILPISQIDERKIRNEYNRRNRKKPQISRKPRGPVEVQIIKRR